ncbi:uncharacterized protein LOC116043922 [Sander lucioperca]|uniref:uncharacterized protein LOC116043922 n=1 Tax=Sander lucioperca TaxID=283035 RepID=UPI00125D0369|nr:uncharacterized protein LOC116043922 [Sander lucioperca]
MVHYLGDVPQGFIKIITKSMGMFLLIALFFILQYLFDMDFRCSCRPSGHLDDVVFMAAPPLILTSIVTLIESIYQMGIFCRCCKYWVNNCCTSFVKFLMKYLFLTAVWTSTVLFDGDWYFCLQTNLNSSQTGIPCRKTLTYEETLIEASYKNDSRAVGFSVLSGILLLWIFIDVIKAWGIRWSMWKRSSVSGYNLCCPPYYRWVYEGLLSEEVSSLLKDELRKIAKERAKKLCAKHLMTIREHETQGQYPDGTSGNIPDENAHGGNPNGSGNPTENEDDHLDDNSSESVTEDSNSHLIPENENNEQDNIFDTWQKISLSSFYMLNEGV